MPPLLGTVNSEPGALPKEAPRPLQNYSAVKKTAVQYGRADYSASGLINHNFGQCSAPWSLLPPCPGCWHGAGRGWPWSWALQEGRAGSNIWRGQTHISLFQS